MDKLKHYLLQAGIDKAPPDFTESVMSEILNDAPETAAPTRLKSILFQNAVEAPPSNFTHTVISQLQNSKRKSIDEPVVNKKVAYGMAAAFALLIAVIVSLDGGTSSSDPSYFATFGKLMGSLLQKAAGMSILFPVIIFSSAVLLLIDQIIRSRFLKQR